jgi:hypothetical protein
MTLVICTYQFQDTFSNCMTINFVFPHWELFYGKYIAIITYER